MPRANRYFIPGQVWHLTHRCHKKEFLLKFEKDRKIWIKWLYEAKQRYGLCVLNYIVTSNHIHLLVYDTGTKAIPNSMQLIAGRIAQQFNQRKKRKGAYWSLPASCLPRHLFIHEHREDRYHATAIQTGEHLVRCLVYIDLNMVRAGVVSHPSDWQASGYQEIQTPPMRKRIIDIEKLAELCEIYNIDNFRTIHRQWIEDALKEYCFVREAKWSEAVAVGCKAFVEETQQSLGLGAKARSCQSTIDGYQLKEAAGEYSVHFGGKKVRLTPENGCFWNEIS
jgi:REP element-mobilizing transposase RayT